MRICPATVPRNRAPYAETVGRNDSGELGLIRALRQRAQRSITGLRVGIGDDCAVLRVPAGHEVVVTTDFSLEGRHFRRDWHTAQSVGHRCLARGLSDIAAMGATPRGAFLSLALPSALRSTTAGRRWVEDFFTGLLRLADATGTPLSGGDTAAAPGDAVLADIVLVGSAPRRRALLRSGARAGEVLYVTGALGGSAAELAALAAAPRRFRRAADDGPHPHLFPAPRLAVGKALLQRGLATAAIDVSDGLSTDLRHLCKESGVGAMVEADSLPIHPLAQGSLEQALHGGEDYELLFTARSGTAVPRKIAGVPLTRIGLIVDASHGIMMRTAQGDNPLHAAGWEHRL